MRREYHEKVEPTPTLLATEIDPPILSTSSLHIERPKPLPPNLLDIEESAWGDKP